MALTIDKAIFITNIFAEAHPDRHVPLWNQFEMEVPVSKRTGAYGVDNLAYIGWLKQKQDPVFLQFMKDHVSIITL